MRKLILIPLLLLTKQQQAAETKEILSIAGVAAALTAGSILAIEKGYHWYTEADQKKKKLRAQKDGDTLCTRLQTQYAKELEALKADQISRRKLLEIIQENNHENDAHPVRPWSIELNKAISQLKQAIFLEKKEEAKKLCDDLEQLRMLKNKQLQRDYETAEKAYFNEQFEQQKRNLELQKIKFEHEAARIHYENEQKCTTVLTKISDSFKFLLSEIKQQATAIPALITMISHELGTIKNKQDTMSNELKKQKENSQSLKKINKEMQDIKQEQKEQKTILAILTDKLNSLTAQNDPAYAHASAPLYPDLKD